MADDEIRTASIQHDEPAHPHAESRVETVARVAGPEEAAIAERGGSSDPSTRRGLNRWLGRNQAILAVCGFVVGAIVALVLSLSPGPVETHNVWGVIGYMIVLGVAGALGFVVIGSLLLLAREDGRIERRVEQDTGREPAAPAQPSRPEHDPEPL